MHQRLPPCAAYGSVLENVRIIPAKATRARSKLMSDTDIINVKQGDVEFSTTMSAFADS